MRTPWHRRHTSAHTKALQRWPFIAEQKDLTDMALSSDAHHHRLAGGP